jgi:hypothetical protein
MLSGTSLDGVETKTAGADTRRRGRRACWLCSSRSRELRKSGGEAVGDATPRIPVSVLKLK